MLSARDVRSTGFDAAALKPSKVAITDAVDLPFDFVTVDYEGNEHVPTPQELHQLADEVTVRFTVPIRADGFDPLGDDTLFEAIPKRLEIVLVAGNPAYLSPHEINKSIAPRLTAALKRTPGAWIGTEGIERLALATGATQFDLLSPTTVTDFRSLKTAGFDGDLAVYAPTVIADDDATVLDAVGSYVARREPIRRQLHPTTPTDSTAPETAREILLAGAQDYVLAGNLTEIRAQIDKLVDAGADHVVGYPARGLTEFGVSP